jgi:hypothetical protein
MIEWRQLSVGKAIGRLCSSLERFKQSWETPAQLRGLVNPKLLKARRLQNISLQDAARYFRVDTG